MNFKFSAVVSIILFCIKVECSKILAIYPTPSISHQFVFRALTKELIKRGHELTVITSHPMEFNNTNLTQIDLSAANDQLKNALNFVVFRQQKGDMFDLMNSILEWIGNSLDVNFQNGYVQKLIKRENGENFDVVIVEALYDGMHLLRYIRHL